MTFLKTVLIAQTALWAPFAGAEGLRDSLRDPGAALRAGEDTKALRLAKPAAGWGDPSAQNILGMMYHEGYGVAEDKPEAMKWFRKSAYQGDAKAEFNLGVMYYEGSVQDAGELGGLFAVSGMENSAQSLFTVGGLAVADSSVSQDFREAARWFRKAAAQGVSQADFNLGVMYAKGEGVRHDDQEAVRWFHKAAYKDLPAAQFKMGLVHEHGIAVPRDGVEAYKWYLLAAAHGRFGWPQSARDGIKRLRPWMRYQEVQEARQRAEDTRREIEGGGESLGAIDILCRYVPRSRPLFERCLKN